MDLTPYVESLRRQLAASAETGGDDTVALAERLGASLDAAARLALLDALSDAAAEITRDLAPGSVDVRLRGGDPDFVVTPPAPDEPEDDDPGASGSIGDVRPAGGAAAPTEGDDAGIARVTLRLPDQLKARAERAASDSGMSVNAWLVRAVASALHPDDRARRSGRPGRGTQRYTGWAR